MKYYYGYQIKDDEMIGACSLCRTWGNMRCIQTVSSGNLKGRDRLEDLGVHERIILK